MVLLLWLMRLATIENGIALEDGVATMAELKAFLLRSSTFCFFFSLLCSGLMDRLELAAIYKSRQSDS